MTPPAIAPAFVPLLEDDADWDVERAVPGVTVDWLLVEVGTIEALPVISGESVITLRVNSSLAVH
jgi:hypothetical protein